VPFGIVSGVSRMMGVLDGVVIVEGEGSVLGVNLGRPTEINGDYAEYLRKSDALFSNHFEDLFYNRKNVALRRG